MKCVICGKDVDSQGITPFHVKLSKDRQGVLCFKHACELLKLSKDCELTGAAVVPENATSGPAIPRETLRAQAVAAKGPDKPSDTQQTT